MNEELLLLERKADGASVLVISILLKVCRALPTGIQAEVRTSAVQPGFGRHACDLVAFECTQLFPAHVTVVFGDFARNSRFNPNLRSEVCRWATPSQYETLVKIQ
jgi:hypothetical protein